MRHGAARVVLFTRWYSDSLRAGRARVAVFRTDNLRDWYKHSDFIA